jgi:hypothetical protein
VRHLQLLKDGFEVEGSTGASAPGNSASAKQFCETLHTAPEHDEYTEFQLYSHDETALYYKLLPNKSSARCCLPVRLEITR